MGASGVIMFSILPPETLGAQDESASEAMTTMVKTIKYALGSIPCEASLWNAAGDGGLSSPKDDRSIPCFGNVLIFCFIQELLTVIFAVYQSACLAIYIRNDDLVTFDELP